MSFSGAALAERGRACILFLRRTVMHFLTHLLVKGAGRRWRTPPFSLAYNLQDLDLSRPRHRQHVASPDGMTALGDANTVHPQAAAFNEFLRIRTVLHDARIDQPLVDALAQVFSFSNCALRAPRTAKGELGSAGRSLRRGRSSLPLPPWPC